MADFVAVLRKTVSALGENTPEMREKVYEKARATIEAKLAALDPQPPAVVVDRQRKALEDAIDVIRADYASAEPEDDFGDLIASLEVKPQDTPLPPPVSREPEPIVAPAYHPVAAPEEQAFDPSVDEAQPAADDVREDVPVVADFAPRPEAVAAPRAPARAASPRSSRSGGSRGIVVAALFALLVVAGGAYALWLNRDDLFGPGQVVAEAPEEDVVTTAEELVEAVPEEEPAVEEEVAVLPPVEETPPEPAPPVQQEPAAGAVEKFTQRLLSDGSEVDDGPAGGQRTIGEGTSVANVVPADDQTADEETQTAETTPAPQADTAQPAIAVGQRAIFYEERTSSAQGSAEMGSIVWSVVQESPGGDLPPEPAIRAEASIPAKDVQLRMTIRRNGDQTLPAAHIVEMIFLTPEGFEGGAVSNVSRVAFKETEQAAGNPLIGIPAKIADGFFLIALSDSPNEIESNMTLLGSRSWIDIPIVYQSGRRALLSLEKGIPGERAFQETLQAWQDSASAG